MRKEYDFSKAKKNPYASRLKKQVPSGLMRKRLNILRNSPKKRKFRIKP